MQQGTFGWQQTVTAYLSFLQLRGVSHRTIETRAGVFKLFHRFHEEECLSCTPATCSTQHCSAYIPWLRRRGDKPATVDSHYRFLRAFFNWMVAEGLRADNPILAVPKVKLDNPLPRTVTEDHLLAVLRVLNHNDFATLRNRALFLLAFDSGARLGELINLRLADVDLTQRTAIVRGKGNRERLIYFGAATAQALIRYLTRRALLFGEVSPNDFLFVSTDGSQMKRNAVLLCWRRAQRKAGVPQLTFHGLRHGFARAWLLAGGDAFSLQLLLGHRSATTTQRYVHLWAHDLAKLHQQHSPVDRLLRERGGRRKFSLP